MRIRAALAIAMALALALPAYSSTLAHRRASTHRGAALRGHRTHRTAHASLHRTAIRHRREAAAETIASAHLAPLSRIRFVPPLRGSRASLLRQNERDAAEGLERIEDTAQLDDMEEDGKLVPVPAELSLRVNPDLPMDRRYCRPWTARFLANLARSHYARFHRPLQVNSAVRTVAFQRALLQINGNAAPAEGDIASPHLTGAAIDIGKRGMTFSEIAWMRAWLLPLQAAGKIDVEEEFYQACFHITVYRNYIPGPVNPRRASASSTLLATQVR